MFSMIFFVTTLILLVLFVLQTIRLNILKKQLFDQESNDESLYLELDKVNEVDPNLIDTLTGLPNRIAFEQKFAQLVNFSKRFHIKFGIIYIDIEKMSAINKLDYETGNDFLKVFPSRVQNCVRQIDTIARYAGDKFILLLPQLTRPETAAYVAQRIQSSMIQPFKIHDHEILTSVNMGITIYPIDGTDLETLTHRANSAMLKAKEAGNKYQFYSPEIQALGEREQRLLNYFKTENIFKDINIEYNSFFHIEKNKFIYAEAIPTLIHPELGLLSDSEFKKVAEKSGQFCKITEYLIRNSFLQLKKWNMQGIDIEKMAINVPMNKIEKTELLNTIKNVLNEINMNANQLILQFNKDNLHSNLISLENALNKIDESGIQVAISVLVLGHSSLQNITHHALNFLIIEEELTKTLLAHQNNKAIIDRIILLASRSDITVVAEGIETEEQKEHLKSLGCTIMSGKLFQTPIPVTYNSDS